MTITICSSAHFYRQAIEIQEQLQKMGFTVIVPKTATLMKERGDFDTANYKTWFGDTNDYPKKAALIRAHFDEITKGDAILVLNYGKHGKTNYIGGNVLMEMSLAFYQKKPIIILNDAPEESSFIEEILGMQPTFLHGQLEKISEVLTA